MDVIAEDASLYEESPSEQLDEPQPAVDAVIHVFITDNGLNAYFYLEPPQNGGAAPTIDALKNALTLHRISYHVDFKMLRQLATNPIYGEDIIIARGLAPENGLDGTATFLIKTEREGFKPKDNDNGTVNYHDLDIIENVTKGQVLCTITLPTEGAPGMSVQGKELPQKKGQAVPSYLGRNTELSQDGKAILSKIDGQVEFSGNKIHVDQTFYIKENVDNSTGNLHVAGNLVIAGMVLPGFVIDAAGNIEIHGAVEGATIRAGGNVSLKSGIYSSELTCEGDLRCRFIDNSTVFAKGDVLAESILHSTVTCGKNIKVEGKIAKIIGGSCMAGQNIEVDTVGSMSNVKTKLELGTDPSVIQRQKDLLTEISKLEAQNEKLGPLLDILQQLEKSRRLSLDKQQSLEDVRFTYETNKAQLQESKKELDQIAEAIRAKGFGRIQCLSTIHPGTTVVIGGANMVISDTLTNTMLYYKDGDVCVGSAR